LWKHPNTSSTRLRATYSSTPLFYIFCVGGRYTFPIQIFSPPCTCIHTPCVYSFPICLITWMPFLTSIAMPPLFPFSRRCSNTWYPGIPSLTADFINQVSYKHSTSSVCMPSSMYTLSRLMPAIFWLPIDIPYFSHLDMRAFCCFLTLADPFVRFLPFLAAFSVSALCPVCLSAATFAVLPFFCCFLLVFFNFSCARGGTFC
jgi:hypothetical protein